MRVSDDWHWRNMGQLVLWKIAISLDVPGLSITGLPTPYLLTFKQYIRVDLLQRMGCQSSATLGTHDVEAAMLWPVADLIPPMIFKSDIG